MLDINILLIFILALLISCKNVKEFSEKNDTLIDGKYHKDSILLVGFDPFIDEDCAMEISKIVEEEIIAILQEEHIKQKNPIWIAITFRGNGEILDFRLKNVKIPNTKDKILKNNIIKKRINFKCDALNNMNAVERQKIISWDIPIYLDK